MISASEMQKGLTIDIEGEPYTVLDWRHDTEGREKANIWLKLRHLRTHAIIEWTQDAGHKLKLVPVDRLPVTFMYWDGELYHFAETGVLDPDTPDEFLLSAEMLGKASKYIVDGLQLDCLEEACSSSQKRKSQRKELSTMADQRVLELIKQQLFDRWNFFRQEHPEEAIDLSRADLSETNLSKMNLIRADLRGADLSSADFWEASLSGAYLAGANLSNANLTKADLSYADLSRADLSDAVLREANLLGALLIDANLSRADLCEANLKEAIITSTQLGQALPLDECL